MVLMAKQSCPFIYSFNGEDFEFTGEIYSGAIHKPLERHDYLRLPSLKKTAKSEFLLKIANEIEERQHTNLAELYVYDHPQDLEVLVDKYGLAHTLEDIVSPVSAQNSMNESMLSSISTIDKKTYISSADYDSDKFMDEMHISFDKPDDVSTGKLVLRARNTFWLDYVMKEFSALFGNKFKKWQKKQSNAKAEDILKKLKQESRKLLTERQLIGQY